MPPEGSPVTEEAVGVAMVIPVGTEKVTDVSAELDAVVKP